MINKYNISRSNEYYRAFPDVILLENKFDESIIEINIRGYNLIGFNRSGYIHIAFSLGSKEAVNELTERLKNDGFHIISGPRTTGDGYYESCIIGIEGNQIELTE